MSNLNKAVPGASAWIFHLEIKKIFLGFPGPPKSKIYPIISKKVKI
jgi:hypothetical protein